MSQSIDALAARLPGPLKPLAELALDLHWTWSHGGDALWNALEPDIWERTANPYWLLLNVSDQRLRELAADADFCQRLGDEVDARRKYLAAPGHWTALCQAQGPCRIAYFSMEFGIAEALPLYAGGLGVLAGDYLKAASDLGLPVVGVGLMYQEGYFRQQIDAQGQQHALYSYNDPASLPVSPLYSDGGAWRHVSIELPGRSVRLRVWQAQVGRVPLYLLDSNDPWNAPDDRGITGKLYGGGVEDRLVQELVLGIGGWRLLDELGLDVEICHLNEGHAAFAALERAACYARDEKLSFAAALWATRAGNVFTTHTPVPAGFDVFDVALLRRYLRDYVAAQDAGLGIDLDEIVALGHDGDPLRFNMAFFAARSCASINAVSRLHAEVSRGIFAELYPRWPLSQVPVGYVTNGVHMPSWDSRWADALWTRSCGAERWKGAIEGLEVLLAALSDEAIWELRGRQRADLVHFARRRLSRQLRRRGQDSGAIVSAESVLDTNILTLGFARRFAEYKRPNLLLRDRERLLRLLTNSHRPVQLLVAGKAHPQDQIGQGFIREWMELLQDARVRGRVVFLEDYDLAVAAELVQGVDVWINTPRRPWEACGTSGMKVLVNGGLNVSVRDGWWEEAYAPDVGWAVGDGASREPSVAADQADAESLMDILENEVVPLFYARDADGMPRQWIARIRASVARLTPQFSTNRMMQDYIEREYRPAAARLRRRCADQAAIARSLQSWSTQLQRHWADIHLGPLHLSTEGMQWRMQISVYLGELRPEDVCVQIYADETPEETAPSCLEMQCLRAIPGATHGYIYEILLPASGDARRYTPRVIPGHAEACVPQELALIRWPV